MKMKWIENRAFLFLVLFIGSAAFCMAQNIGSIAILPFNGGSQDESNGIAELFSGTQEMMSNFRVIPRTTIANAIEREQRFQLSSGMTDADTMARLGNQFGANYVMAGSITSLGGSRLLIVSIIKIDVIQQVAGAFLVYNSLDDFNKDETIIGKMAAELVSLMKKDTGKMDKLAVLPVQFSGGVNENSSAIPSLSS
jgi:TolB-like protein